MRVSGLALVFLALVHFALTHIVNDVAETDSGFVADRWANPLWRTFDWLLLMSSLWHGVLGLRYSIGDYLRRPGLRVLGFAGMWVMLDEAHITTIGVVPELRRRSLGELLFVTLVEEAIRRRARWVTLEVRVSNYGAQTLYEKYGFTRQGVRKRYYSDNGEDAHIMWSPSLHESETRERYRELRAELERKLPR